MTTCLAILPLSQDKEKTTLPWRSSVNTQWSSINTQILNPHSGSLQAVLARKRTVCPGRWVFRAQNGRSIQSRSNGVIVLTVGPYKKQGQHHLCVMLSLRGLGLPRGTATSPNYPCLSAAAPVSFREGKCVHGLHVRVF